MLQILIHLVFCSFSVGCLPEGLTSELQARIQELPLHTLLLVGEKCSHKEAGERNRLERRLFFLSCPEVSSKV